MKGFGEVCKLPYADAAQLVTHPVACLDCHDPETTALRVTRLGMSDFFSLTSSSRVLNLCRQTRSARRCQGANSRALGRYARRFQARRVVRDRRALAHESWSSRS